MEYTIEERTEYIEILKKYYKTSSISHSYLFNYFKKNGGREENINNFVHALTIWTQNNFNTIIENLNKKFEVMLITKDNKFITAL